MKPIFVIKDRAVDSYGDPFPQNSTQEAIRNFRDLVNEDPQKNQIARHPDDYDLYIVAEFNPEDAIVYAHKIELIARGKDLVQPKGN